MDSLPPEILIQILSNLHLDEKYVVRRVCRLWKEAADIAIAKQHRLIVYPDDKTVRRQYRMTYFDRVPYNSEVAGIRVDRLLIAMRMHKLSVLSGIRELNLAAAVARLKINKEINYAVDDEPPEPQEIPASAKHGIWKKFTDFTKMLIPSICVSGNDEDEEWEKRMPSLLTVDEAVSLLEGLAPNLSKLVIQCPNVLKRIKFPSLKAYECTELVFHSVNYTLFPILEELTLYYAYERIIGELVDAYGERLHLFKKLVIHNYLISHDDEENDPLPDALKQMSNLTHLDIAINYTNFLHDLFEHLHHLVIVKLEALHPQDNLGSENFSDSGVRILLQNNQNLREVGLYGLELTDLTLMCFADYVTTHGLRKLALRSTGRFSEASKNMLREAGEHKLQHLHIADADTQHPIVEEPSDDDGISSDESE
jgi:hypothetical protein